jgi:hypothetical protein
MVMTAIPTVALGSRTFLGAFTLARRRLALFGARVMPVSLGPQMRELLLMRHRGMLSVEGVVHEARDEASDGLDAW